MKALSLPGCGCRLAFQLAVLGRLEAAGERFDLVAGASSGSLSGAAWVTGNASRGRELFGALMGTKVLSMGWLWTEKSPFGMSRIVREALEAHLPEQQILASPIELLVATTPLRTLVGHLVHRNGKAVVHSTRELAKRGASIHDVLLASCTFPPFYARLPRLDGRVHIDGGITDNTLVESLVERGADEITVITPHASGEIYQALRRGFGLPPLPSRVRVKVICPERTLRLGSFDFDERRVLEALDMPHVERSSIR